MKHLFYLTVGLFMLFASSESNAQNEGIANDRNGVVIYLEAMPQTQYRHKGTIECAMFSPDELEPLLDHMIEQAKKKYEDEFDALIFRPGKGICKADVVTFYKDPKAKRSRGRSKDEPQVNPEYKKSKVIPRGKSVVYIQNNPAAEYNLLGRVELPVTFRSKDYEELLAEIIKVATSKYPDMDAMVVMDGSGVRKASAIKFK